MNRRWMTLVRLLPPIAVALLVAPIYSGGYRGWPWNPKMIDLAVYRHGVEVLLAGGDVLTSTVPGADLVFTYPPFALFVFLPLVALPWTVLQALWTAAGAVALYAVLHGLGLRGWRPSLITAGLLFVCEPVRGTLILGQINLFLMALIMFDLVLRGRSRASGVLTGLTAAIKLTPGIFAIMAAFARDWRVLRNLVVAAGVCTLTAAVILPAETMGWLRSLAGGDTRAGNLEGQINQSVLGAVVRIAGLDRPQYLAGLVLAVIAGLFGAYVAAQWYRERPALGVCLAAVAALLASPISWDHHFVWVVPLAVLLWDRALPVAMRVTGWAYVLWMGSGLYAIGSPIRGPAPLHFEPWQITVGAVGPALGITLLVAAAAGSRARRADLRACESEALASA